MREESLKNPLLGNFQKLTIKENQKSIFMSLTKRYLLDESRTGFVSTNIGKYVCANCFLNEGIKEFINDNGNNNTCNYCKTKTTKTITLDLEEVANHIYECISREWYHGDTLREED